MRFMQFARRAFSRAAARAAYEASGGAEANTLRDTGIPVIVVTAKAAPIDKVLWMNVAQVDDYVTKPFGPADLLASVDGTIVVVRAAAEPVSEVRCDDPLLLARACYHLGNRHVPLQIEPGFVRYQHDHVLDEMLQGLGLSVAVCQAPFEPEPGAYGGHGHSHSH